MVRFGSSTGVITAGPSSVNHRKVIGVNDTAAAAMVRRDGVAAGCSVCTAAAMGSTTAAAAAAMESAAADVDTNAAATGCTSPTHWRHLI